MCHTKAEHTAFYGGDIEVGRDQTGHRTNAINEEYIASRPVRLGLLQKGDVALYNQQVQHTAHRTPHTAHRTPHTAHRTPYTAHRALAAGSPAPSTHHAPPYTLDRSRCYTAAAPTSLPTACAASSTSRCVYHTHAGGGSASPVFLCWRFLVATPTRSPPQPSFLSTPRLITPRLTPPFLPGAIPTFTSCHCC